MNWYYPMADLVLGAVGAAIGSTFGMPSLGWSIGSTLGSMLTPKKTTQLQGPRLNELKIQNSEYAHPIPIVFGGARIAGNIIWATDLIEVPVTETQGGKGGGGGVETTTYTYYANFAVGVCEGEVAGVTRIWADDTVIYWPSQGLVPSTVRPYLGDDIQTPNPLIESYLGTGEVPAYRGLVYIVFENLLLTRYGNRIPNITVEVSSDGSTTPDNLPLGTVLKRISTKSLLPPEVINTDAIASDLEGYIITSTMDIKSAIIPLASSFGFDVVESDNVIKFVSREGTSSTTIRFEELVTNHGN